MIECILSTIIAMEQGIPLNPKNAISIGLQSKLQNYVINFMYSYVLKKISLSNTYDGEYSGPVMQE